jgi:NADPH:quinone reductase
MRRLRFDEFGLDALRLEETSRPEIAAGQTLVRVKAAGLNPSDLTNVKGGFSQTKLPRTPGRDYAGVVEEGPKDWVGAEVWGSGAELGFTMDGAHADYVVVPAASLTRKPANLSFAAAAAAGVPFVAAYVALVEKAELREGETVLIVGARGSVGHAARELAQVRKARAIGVDREADEIDGMEVIASSGDVAAAVRARTGGRGVDVCLDAVGGPLFQVALASLANGGRLAVIAAAKGDANVTFDMRDFYHRELRLIGVDTLKKSAVASASIQRELAPLFESGALTVDAPEEIPLDQAVDAYHKLETGSKRKMALVTTAGKSTPLPAP